MKHDEWTLTKELGRLREYGFCLQAERVEKEKANERYNIVFEKSREILEPYCSIEEVIGITNSLETCFEKIKDFNKCMKENSEKDMQHG